MAHYRSRLKNRRDDTGTSAILNAPAITAPNAFVELTAQEGE